MTKRAIEYETKNPKRLSKAKAQRYGAALQKMAKAHGGVTPESLVDAARDPLSVFHSYFEWNLKKAAHAFRLWQARHLIREITLHVTYAGSRKPRDMELRVQTRAFQSISGKGGRSYQHIDVIKRNDAYQKQVVDRIAREIERLGAELAVYEHLDSYVVELQDVARRLKKAS